MKEQLPAFLLAELYTDSIVQIDKEIKQELSETVAAPSKNLYLGSFEKKIVVLVNDKENSYISDDNLNFLTGILNACKLNMAHIALINFYNDPVSFLILKKELQAEFLISFGITSLQIELPFAMPDYQVQDYSKCKILIVPSLNELNRQTQPAKTEKAKLWKSLQKMFDLE
ncbi:MAG TPA: hypothetical protein VGI61_01665 [Parafilimonas sp.]